MKRLVKYNAFLILLVLFAACKDQGLDDFKLVDVDPSVVSADNSFGEVKKVKDRVHIPLRVSLSRPATRAFQVGIELNIDTVQHLIASGVLQNTVALAASSIELPSVVVIPFGASSATFEISIDFGDLERLYGKKVALAFNLVEPGKGNQLGAKASNLIVLNTLDLLSENEIHYLSFTNGRNEIIEARNRRNYTVTSGGISVPLGLSLKGTPGRFFSVTTELTNDTIKTLIAKGKLPANTVILNEKQLFMETLINVASNTTSAPYEVTVPTAVINANMGKVVAFSVTMKESTRHLIDDRYKQVVVLVYPDYVVETDITKLGVLTVNKENDQGANSTQGSSKVVDGDYNTTFYLKDSRSPWIGDFWFKLVFKEPQNIGAYTLTSSSATQNRDPKSWVMEASTDGTNWTIVDERTGFLFGGRKETRKFEIKTPKPYTHYRLNIKELYGPFDLFQLMEWRMIATP